jgi:multimeric flavodoxin WrbA
MKVLGIVGSPRKNGNMDLLGSRILDVTNANNNLTEKLYLYEFKIFPCVD